MVWLEVESNYGALLGPLRDAPIAKPINSDKPTDHIINSDGQCVWVMAMFVPQVWQYGDCI